MSRLQEAKPKPKPEPKPNPNSARLPRDIRQHELAALEPARLVAQLAIVVLRAPPDLDLADACMIYIVFVSQLGLGARGRGTGKRRGRARFWGSGVAKA